MTWTAAFLSQDALVHAVPARFNRHDAALCKLRPSYRSQGWKTDCGAEITCPRCLAKLKAAEAA